MTFATRLRKAREQTGLTQAELAKLVGVSFSTVNRIENGHHDPSPLVLNAFKAFFKKKSIPFDYDQAED